MSGGIDIGFNNFMGLQARRSLFHQIEQLSLETMPPMRSKFAVPGIAFAEEKA